MKHLAVGPGAVGYFALLGGLNKLWDDGMLNDLETLSGSSSGALAVCMMAIHKFDFQKILQTSLKVPISHLKPNIKSLFESYGFVPRETIRTLIETCIPDVTFEELFKTFPIKIYLSAFCIELSQTHYFSVDTHPQMSIVDALCMSVSIPVLFSSFKYGQWNYFDGAANETAPCGHLVGKDSVMILRLKYKDRFEVKDLSSYLQLVLNSFIKLRKTYQYPTCFIDLGDDNVFDFNLGEAVKLRLFVAGYEKVKVPSIFPK